MYLLDTNTLIYFFKGQGRVADNVLSVAPGETFLPCIAVYEIETGIAKSKHPMKLRQDLEDFLAMVSVLPFGLAEARSAAEISEHKVTGSLCSFCQPISSLGSIFCAPGVLAVRRSNSKHMGYAFYQCCISS